MITYQGKRVFDLILSLLALIVLSPLMLLIALGVLIFSGWPIFFCQERIGVDKKYFTIIKFRTMVADAEQKKKEIAKKNNIDSAFFRLKDDPRLTMIGKVLRRFNLDELPQLINILRNDMSWVGPRPISLSKFDCNLDFTKIDLKSGLTGVQQIYSKLTNNEFTSMDKWVNWGSQYAQIIGFWTDVKMIIKTVYVIICKQRF